MFLYRLNRILILIILKKLERHFQNKCIDINKLWDYHLLFENLWKLIKTKLENSWKSECKSYWRLAGSFIKSFKLNYCIYLI